MKGDVDLIKRLKEEVKDEDLRRYLINKINSSSDLYLAKLFFNVYGREEINAFLNSGNEEKEAKKKALDGMKFKRHTS